MSDQERVWASFSQEGEKRITAGTLYFLARQHGWPGASDRGAGFTALLPEPLAAVNGAAEPATNWPIPDMSVVRIARADAPPLPLRAFGSLADWLTTQAEAKGAPVDYVAAGLLTASSALIGATRRALVHPDWSEPSILWNAVLGAPSTNKSPALDSVFGPLRRVEGRLTFDFSGVLRDYEARKLAAATRREAWQAKVRATANTSVTVPPLPPDAEEPEKPTRPRILISDATLEALQRELAQNHRLLLHRDELAGWLGNLDRYGGNGGARAFYLEAFGGRSFTVDRMRDDRPRVIRFMNLPIIGCIQPDRLDLLLLSSDDDGLAARFLYFWPEARALGDWPNSKPDSGLVERVFQRLLTLQLGPDGDPIELPFSQSAGREFREWNVPHTLATRDADGLHASALGKMQGYVARIALVLEHLGWAAGVDAAPPCEISLRSVLGAIELMEKYFKPMLRRVLGSASVKLAERAAAVLARAIIERKATWINLREVRRGWNLPKFTDKQLVEEACRELVEGGWLREAEYSGHGRRPKSFDVNPRVHELATGI